MPVSWHCPWCAGRTYKHQASRVDGLPILRCTECGVASLAAVPVDTKTLYGETYFLKPGRQGLQLEGYDDYEAIGLEEFQWRLSMLGPANDGLLLDVGCATGKFLEVARGAGWRPKGVEVSAYAAGVARAKGFDVFTGTLEGAAFPDDTFDAVTLFDVVEHVEEPRSLLAEVRRVLKPGGCLAIIMPDAGSGRACAAGDGWIGYTASLEHVLYFDATSLRRVLNETFDASQGLIWSMERGPYDLLCATLVRPLDSAPKHGAAGSGKPLRVLMVNRATTFAVPGGDTVQMLQTKRQLENLGAEVDVSLAATPNAAGYDLVHGFNLQVPLETLTQVTHIRERTPEVPLLLSTIYYDQSEKLWGQEAIAQAFRQAKGPGDLAHRLQEVELRSCAVRGFTPWGRNLPHPNFEQAQRALLQLADHLLPNSYMEMQQIGIALGIRNTNFTVIPNAVDPELFAHASSDRFVSRYGVKDFVLCAARKEGGKNQLMLIQALAGLGVPLVLIGAAHDPLYLKLCTAYASPQTLLIDDLPQEELASAYAAARVHVLPSWGETTGLSSLEAALGGCNIVVGDRGSTWEYFREYAYYCDPGSVRSIRDAVVAAYRNYPVDGPRREALRHLVLSRYNWGEAAKQTLEAYHKILSRPARRAAPVVPGTRLFVYLAYPDWSDPSDWQAVIGWFLSRHRPSDDVSLLLRADPQADPPAAGLYQALSEFVSSGLGQDPEQIPDTVIVDDSLDGRREEDLLRQADAFVSSAAVAKNNWRSRASALGKPVIELAPPAATA